MARRLLLVAAPLAAVAGLALAGRTPAHAVGLEACGLPDAKPLWVEYGGGQVPPAVRRVLARPGVVVATSGTRLPAFYRAAGAQTVHFELKLPSLVGTPGQPADPAGVPAAADRLYDQAVASTGCATPRVALNELLGPAPPSPWPPGTVVYRGNVLSLVQRLAERGARPALFVHGNPTFTGESAAWWRSLGASSDVAYEAYFNAVNLNRLGRILGPRRARLGMRSVIRKLVAAGVPRERIGMALGFQAKVGTLGREGLQPTSSWLRVVKWQALAAKQVAADEATDSVWSWGWGVLSADGVDDDKPLAACVYLWARDPSLCDATAMAAAAGTTFDRNRVEGPVAVPEPFVCLSVAGKLPKTVLPPLRQLLGSPSAALDVAFARAVLRRAVPVPTADVLAAEQETVGRAFAGSVPAYLTELERRALSRAVAREAIADVLRRRRIADTISRGEAAGTISTWIADTVSAAVATATCTRDVLPGTGDFPASDQRDVSVPPLLASLPFLFDDRVAPAAPVGLTGALAGGRVVLDWADGAEPDLAGYVVARGPSQTGPWTALTALPMPRSTAFDVAPPPGPPVWYLVHAVDLSGNLSAPALYAVAPPA